jgi:asparagine synthase (glutamine-hydrolysing)
MSGIGGYINNTEKAPSALLDSMSESIRYTKSDRIDKWSDDFLAICRVHHGVINPESQPIFNEEKSLFIVMDGEVFDYEEQKLRLIHDKYKFKFNNNDAEYCLHLYEEMQERAFKELNGSFCFAIYDLATHELLLINDRFSSRALFYYLTDKGTLLFGTQLSAILQSSEVPRELNMRSIFEFFTFQKVLGTETFYKDINVLPPATILRYRDGSISLIPYWEMKYKEEKHREKYYVDKLAEALKKSVERRTQGHYRFGLLLSGGLDSRTVLAASDKKIVCFTVGDFENREVKIAKRIAEAKGCKHIFLKRDLDHYANLVDKAVEIGDGMYSFAHAHNIGFFDRIRKECDILFHAYLFDTLFKGWGIPRKPKKILGKTIINMDLIEAPNDNFYKRKPEQLFTKLYSTQLKSSIMASLDKLLICAEEKGARNFHREFDYFYVPFASNDDAYLYATHNQAYVDGGTVVLDNDLLDLYLETPVKLRIHGRIFKKAIKKINLHIASIPDVNTGFSPAMPVFLGRCLRKGLNIFRKLRLLPGSPPLPHPTYTQGSWPNFAELIRHNEKLKNIIENTIEDPECLNPSIFNTPRIKEMFEEHLTRKADYTEFLFLLLTFGTWHKNYGPNSRV